MSQRRNPLAVAMAGAIMLGLSGPAAFAACSPCAPKKSASDKAKNPCAGKKADPCAAKNPCAAKANPCAAKNPCAARK